MATILLTSAFEPGDLDSGNSYTHVKIKKVAIDLENSSVTFDVERGYFDGETWVAGVRSSLTRKLHSMDGEDYSALISVDFEEALYQKLIDKELYAGEVV